MPRPSPPPWASPTGRPTSRNGSSSRPRTGSRNVSNAEGGPMRDPVEAMAGRARREPHFLGCVLERYARAEGLDDDGLAAALGCAAGQLTDLRLCRAPRLDPAGLAEDVR